ncbi:hypothetical protein YC2023_065037 [Brassica napus]
MFRLKVHTDWCRGKLQDKQLSTRFFESRCFWCEAVVIQFLQEFQESIISVFGRLFEDLSCSNKSSIIG